MKHKFNYGEEVKYWNKIGKIYAVHYKYPGSDIEEVIYQVSNMGRYEQIDEKDLIRFNEKDEYKK